MLNTYQVVLDNRDEPDTVEAESYSVKGGWIDFWMIQVIHRGTTEGNPRVVRVNEELYTKVYSVPETRVSSIRLTGAENLVG